MWTEAGILFAVGLVVVPIMTEWIIRRWNKIIKGVSLPPGSMGLPFLGETLHLFVPSYSLDLHPFIKSRIQRYGPIFRTSIVGQPVVISSDPDFNSYILQQEGKLVELWYLDSFSKITALDQMNSLGVVHKYIRSTLLKQFGADSLREKLLPQLEQLVNGTLTVWSTHASIEVRDATSAMLLNFNAKEMFSYNAERSSESLVEKYNGILDGLMSFPLNIPGTTYHKSKKNREYVLKMLRDMLKHRRTCMSSRETHERDMLDQISDDMDSQSFLSEDFVVHMIFAFILVFSETISGVIPLLLMLLVDHPSVLQELTAEHEAILNNRSGNPNSSLTWEEYKSMTFTLQVINETLRLANVGPGLLRRAVVDIPVKGFIIPKGWTIMIVSASLHLSSETFSDPLEFDPWRWKNLRSDVISKNFMPFGRGVRQCPGAEYTRVFMATFLHVLVTKYKWKKIKGGDIVRNPILGYGKGIHIKFLEKSN